MRCPALKELPPPPQGKSGWPWAEETPQLPGNMPDGSPWPSISIVMASYNRIRFIEETIRSILLQGYPDLEYIIIDGASSDGTVDIIKRYEPWISYWVSEKDKGENPALNKGLPKCTGDIITFFSSDDIYLKGTFADVASKWSMLKYYGAVVGGFYFMDINSQLTTEIIPPRLPHEGPIDLTLVPLEEWRLHQESTFYTRQALDNVGRFVREDIRFNADRELLFRICRKHKVLLAQRTYSAFRRHEESWSKASANRFQAVLEYAKLYLSYCSRHDKDYKRRKQIARHIFAKAYMTYAKYSSTTLRSMAALILVFFYKPTLVIRKSYIFIWLKVLKILPAIKWLRKKSLFNEPQTEDY